MVRMKTEPDKNIEKYISPVVKSKTAYDLLEGMKYNINIADMETGEVNNVTVVNLSDVLSLIMTSQVESSVLVIENLLKDNNIVMTDDLQNSFEDYVQRLKEVINSYKNER